MSDRLATAMKSPWPGYNEITLAGVALVELIGTSLRYRVPEEFAHIVVNYNGMYEPELKRILSGEG